MADPLTAIGLGLSALSYSSARRAQKRAEARARALEAERRKAKKAALKAVKKSYRELDEDTSRALKEALKTGATSLYKSIGGTTQANFARGMFRQFGIAQRQARREEAKAIADIESRSVLDANDFAGLAAGEGALAEMRNDLIKQGIALMSGEESGQLKNSPSTTGQGKEVEPVTADTFGQNVGTSRSRTPGPYASGYHFQSDSTGDMVRNVTGRAFAGFGNVLSNVGDLFTNAYQSISGLFGTTLYVGANDQLYYSDPVAQQSRPASELKPWDSY